MRTFLTDTSVYVPVTDFTCTATTYLYMYLVTEIYYFLWLLSTKLKSCVIYKIKVEISTCNVKKYMYCQFQVLHTKVGDVPLLGSACHAFVWGWIVELTANSEHTADIGASIKVRFTNQSLSTMALSRYKLISNWQSHVNTCILCIFHVKASTTVLIVW